MKRFTVLIAVFLSIVVFCSCSAKTDGTPPLAEGEVIINNLILTLPEGYVLKNSGGIKVACCTDYPEKVNNISFATTGKDSPDSYTKESLDEMFSSLVAGFSGGNSLEATELTGCEVLIYSYNLMLNEKPLVAMQYMVFGSDFTDVITVTLESADDLAAIEDAIKSARVK